MKRTIRENLWDYGVDPDCLDEAEGLILANVRETIKAHVPSLTNADEDAIEEIIPGILFGVPQRDVADLAIRTCSCGERIDGFYQYVDHLIAVFGGESHLGG